MEFDQYPGWELVSGDHRRGPYWRCIAPNWQNPSPAQEECRRKFGVFASQTKGLTGTTPLPDGRILSTSAVEISKALAPKSCIEPLQNDINKPTETEAAAPHDESNSADMPTEEVFVATSTPAEPSRIEPLISLYRDMEEIRGMRRHENEAALQKFNSDFEHLKIDFEKSKAVIDERVRHIEALTRELVDTPHSKAEDVTWSRLQTQIEKIQRKLEEKPVPKQVIKAPEVPSLLPTPNKTADDYSPASFLGTTFALAGLVCLVAWGIRSGDNMATVSDIVHTVNAVLNPGRPAPPSNKP